ncbi:MAG: capsid protein [Cressdnaviricota sp.]|nr:MAG: capsid protein [Cressdnaviricota sp.]
MNGYRSRKSVRSGGGLAARLMRGANRLRNPVAKTTRARTVGGMNVKRFTPRFATVGFNRDVEKKYRDRALMVACGAGERTGAAAGPAASDGVMWTSENFFVYDFSGGSDGNVASPTNNNLLKGVEQGTTATTRIGNVIRGCYLKGAMTLQGAKIVGPSTGATSGDMNGEALATASNATSVYQFLRTTWRVVIVKDLQVNSTADSITWDDVFERGTTYSVQGKDISGVHSELNIANMGRFRIISDNFYKTDAVNPQQTVQYMIGGNTLGNIRYNGPSNNSLTDKGIHIIFAAYVSGVTALANSTTDGMVAPVITMHSRLCFTDS